MSPPRRKWVCGRRQRFTQDNKSVLLYRCETHAGWTSVQDNHNPPLPITLESCLSKWSCSKLVIDVLLCLLVVVLLVLLLLPLDHWIISQLSVWRYTQNETPEKCLVLFSRPVGDDHIWNFLGKRRSLSNGLQRSHHEAGISVGSFQHGKRLQHQLHQYVSSSVSEASDQQVCVSSDQTFITAAG